MNILTMDETSPWRKFCADIGSDIDRGPWIAGGAARRLYQNEGGGADFTTGDIDIFFPTSGHEAAKGRVINALAKMRQGYSKPASYKKTSTDEFFIGGRATRVQMIGQPCEDLTALFRSFDFTVSQFAASGQFLAFTDAARDDLVEMKLDLAVPVQPRKWTTPMRLTKYCFYGFTPAPGVLRWAAGLDQNKVDSDMRIVDEAKHGY